MSDTSPYPLPDRGGEGGGGVGRVWVRTNGEGFQLSRSRGGMTRMILKRQHSPSFRCASPGR